MRFPKLSVGKIFLQNEPFLHWFLTPYLRRIPQVFGLNRALKITIGPMPSEPVRKQTNTKGLNAGDEFFSHGIFYGDSLNIFSSKIYLLLFSFLKIFIRGIFLSLSLCDFLNLNLGNRMETGLSVRQLVLMTVRLTNVHFLDTFLQIEYQKTIFKPPLWIKRGTIK